MSMVQRVAQIFGWVFVVIAIWGFIVSGGSMEADPAMAPKVMGLFPVNVLHNLVHLAFGVWGIAAARSLSGARSYALIAGAIYLVLAILGLFMPTTLGLIPIGGNDIWLHALIAVVLLGAWAASRSATAAPAETTAPATPGPATTSGPTTTTGRGGTAPGSTAPGTSTGTTSGPGTTGPGTRGPGTTGTGSTGTGSTGTGTPPSSTPSSGTTPPGTTGPGSTGPGTTPPPSQDRPATPPPPREGEGDRRP
ncbi:MAG: DUF4383 domain-containing protein [Gemmatimonadetes bacterium]|nr:DUF4383 domain-containing protein [Gemmatimonadota bacterium]